MKWIFLYMSIIFFSCSYKNINFAYPKIVRLSERGKTKSEILTKIVQSWFGKQVQAIISDDNYCSIQGYTKLDACNFPRKADSIASKLAKKLCASGLSKTAWFSHIRFSLDLHHTLYCIYMVYPFIENGKPAFLIDSTNRIYFDNTETIN